MKRRGTLHTLNPGDVVCGERHDKLETLLGSCIAIVLTDPRRTVGVMCHIVHTGNAARGAQLSGAHGEVAFEMMFKLLRARGIDPRQCLAYVYGGGNMFPNQVNEFPVGERNAEWVLDKLDQYRITVVSHDLGGNTYRRLSWTVGPDEPTVVAIRVDVTA